MASRGPWALRIHPLLHSPGRPSGAEPPSPCLRGREPAQGAGECAAAMGKVCMALRASCSPKSGCVRATRKAAPDLGGLSLGNPHNLELGVSSAHTGREAFVSVTTLSDNFICLKVVLHQNFLNDSVTCGLATWSPNTATPASPASCRARLTHQN